MATASLQSPYLLGVIGKNARCCKPKLVNTTNWSNLISDCPIWGQNMSNTHTHTRVYIYISYYIIIYILYIISFFDHILHTARYHEVISHTPTCLGSHLWASEDSHLLPTDPRSVDVHAIHGALVLDYLVGWFPWRTPRSSKIRPC